MQSIKTRWMRVCWTLAAVVAAGPAHAGYKFQLIDYPGSTSTQVFGVNDRGELVGSGFGFTNVASIAFSYEIKTGLFKVIPSASGFAETDALGINDRGLIVGAAFGAGGVPERAFVRSKDGTISVFVQQGWANTEARAVNNHGLVTGYSYNADASSYVGFIYNPASNTFIDIQPSVFTIAQGINDRGEVVGSVTLPADGAYPGSPAGLYSWLRRADGRTTLFQVNGHRTRARGITDSGLITGLVDDPASGLVKGFVARLTGAPGYASLTISDAELLAAPGQVSTACEGITDEGVITGFVIDPNGATHGFIARPTED